MTTSFFKYTMSFSPKVLLSSSSRERCVARVKELPTLAFFEEKPTTLASVLVPLCVVGDEVHILYTKRSMNLKIHKGQVSFPGGKMDNNESVVETALRETEEEIGVAREDVDVWGQMSGIQGRNKDMLITPVIGEIKNFKMDKLTPNPQEVEEIFTVPISALCNTENHAHLEFKPPLPVYMYGKHKIWGITGLITHLFLQCLLPENVYRVDFLRKKFTLSELTMLSKL
ncbi:mitochondrial coenzyme A diphosphatase NUDT8-like [Pectinophora gossypiella]|uniref:mitochondrial coenzyme A diphosphatase NUDT8-like n=1 Tax=Pectinophora gossypiella TaxID=13191 RepID=UPI00214E5202|nr:mitochondrial coenzyme A diphosphatase NUDT8-like [Pectinophora gossypiella]